MHALLVATSRLHCCNIHQSTRALHKGFMPWNMQASTVAGFIRARLGFVRARQGHYVYKSLAEAHHCLPPSHPPPRTRVCPVAFRACHVSSDKATQSLQHVLIIELGLVQGKARALSADDDAKSAALQWASEAAFGSTEVAAPKILGDIVESLVGAVYIDTDHDFDKTWQVSWLPASAS